MANLDLYIRRDLKPRHLRLLVALDDFRNMGKVAESINVSQSAVSKSLAMLQRALGVDLFERAARGLRPTIYGECLVRHARSVLAELADAGDELKGITPGTKTLVRVGALSHAAVVLLPRALASFKRISPEITVTVREGTMEALLPELWLDKVDIIVGRLPRHQHLQGFAEKILSSENMVLVVRHGHLLTKSNRLRWSDLMRYPWVLPPSGTMPREALELAFERHAVTLPNNRIETLSLPVITSYLQITDAIGVLGGNLAKHYQELNRIAILPLVLSTLVRPVGVIWSQQRPPSPGAKLMIQCLEEVPPRVSG